MNLSRRSTLVAGIAAMAFPAAVQAAAARYAVVELRQYTLRPGMRETMIALFEREFIDPQTAVGSHVLGIFRDLDDPSRFVWLRGFDSMETRGKALAAFYGGEIWKAHKSAANATILDSDNVLLLRPVTDTASLASRTGRPGVIGARIHYLRGVDPSAFTRFFDATLRPRIAAAGAEVLAAFVTETTPNNFPRLPVRERDSVFVWLTRHDSERAEKAFSAKFAVDDSWRTAVPEPLWPAFFEKAEHLRLTPTTRSGLR